MRCFTFNKPSSTILYPIWYTQLVSTVTKKKNKNRGKKKTRLLKRLRLTKIKLKAKLEYEQVKEITKRFSKMKENSPNL